VRLLALLGVVAAAFVAADSALPSSPIAEKQAEAQRVLGQIDRLGHALDLATERYNGATLRLSRIRASLRLNERELRIARHDYRIAADRLGARVRQIYMEGPGFDSSLEVFLGARTVDDVITGLENADRVHEQDGQMIVRTRRYKAAVTRREAVLTRVRKAQERLVAQRAADRARISSGLAEQRRLLSSIKAEIVRLKQEEAAREARLAAEAQARLAAERAAQQQALRSSILGATVAGAYGANGLPSGAVVPASSIGARVVQISMQYLGDPYVWGAAGPTTFDCSGLVSYVFAQVGISLPHFAASQWNYGTYVPVDQLEPGDLVFFENLGHVGIYVGGGDYIQAPQPGDVVKITPLSESWSAVNYYGAKRITG
jgi:cell wall-associated NlpC family hydrolase